MLNSLEKTPFLAGETAAVGGFWLLTHEVYHHSALKTNGSVALRYHPNTALFHGKMNVAYVDTPEGVCYSDKRILKLRIVNEPSLMFKGVK
jgi:hypothetical protein